MSVALRPRNFLEFCKGTGEKQVILWLLGPWIWDQ